MTSPDNLDAIRADDELLEDLRAGVVRDADDLERALTEFRDYAQGGDR